MAVFYRHPTKQLSQLSRCLYWKPLCVSAPMNSVVKITNTVSFEKLYSTKNVNIDTDKPVKFSTSEAAKWKAEYSRMGEKDDSPPSQPYFVTFSLAVFLLYFLVLREENDIDIKLGSSSGSDIKTYLESIQLKAIVEHNKKNNIQTDEDIINRLKELEDLGTQVSQV